MKFPCELLAEPYLAQLRLEVAYNLRDLQYTQTEIAALLQVSQPVISGYLRKSRHQSQLPQVILSRAREVAAEITAILHTQGLDGTEAAIRTGCLECKIMRQAGPTCMFHKQETSYLSENCTSCLTAKPLVQLQVDKQGVLQDLSSLFDDLISHSQVNRLIPEIGMQIVHGITEPRSMSDIAAFPGRIIKRKNSSPLADTPVFGGSETTSQLLLDLRKKHPALHCIAAIKTTDWLQRRLEQIEIPIQVIEGLEEHIQELIADILIPAESFVLVGKKSIGFESISYVCADSTNTLGHLLQLILG